MCACFCCARLALFVGFLRPVQGVCGNLRAFAFKTGSMPRFTRNSLTIESPGSLLCEGYKSTLVFCFGIDKPSPHWRGAGPNSWQRAANAAGAPSQLRPLAWRRPPSTDAGEVLDTPLSIRADKGRTAVASQCRRALRERTAVAHAHCWGTTCLSCHVRGTTTEAE